MLMIAACINTTKTQETEVKKENNQPIPKAAKGIWILSDYMDSIVIDRSIAKHRVKPLSWTALQVEVSDSGLLCYGSINQGVFVGGNIGDGITLNEPASGIDIQYVYDASEDILLALNMKDSTVSNYMRSAESFLYKDSGVFWDIEPKLHSYFVTNAFAGTYVNLATNDTVIFDPKYNMSGIGDFNQYNIDMFMGTSHPFNDGDRITYYGDNTRAINYFEFKGDTLVLYSYKIDPNHDDDFIKDKEVMRLLKVK